MNDSHRSESPQPQQFVLTDYPSQSYCPYLVLERVFRPVLEECRLIAWVQRALNLRGKPPTMLAFAIARLAMEYGRAKHLPITERWIRDNSFRRAAVYRLLRALESAGMLTVDRTNRRYPVVSIVETDDNQPDPRRN